MTFCRIFCMLFNACTLVSRRSRFSLSLSLWSFRALFSTLYITYLVVFRFTAYLFYHCQSRSRVTLTGYEPSMATETKVVNLVPLNNRNYSTWKLQCQMALMKDGLWNIVNETEAPPQVGADAGCCRKVHSKKR